MPLVRVYGPRYSGLSSDIDELESLIIEGVNKVGGQASKGTTFRFDCSSDGVSVSVNDIQQGTAAFDGLGSSFVDVFMDDNAVSPTLVDRCINTWLNKKAIASSLMELSSMAEKDDTTNEALEHHTKEVDSMAERVTIEAKLKPIQEYATSVIFAPILEEGLYLVELEYERSRSSRCMRLQCTVRHLSSQCIFLYSWQSS